MVVKSTGLALGKCEFNPWLRTIPGGGSGNPLQYSCLENPMDRGAWWAAVQRIKKSRTRLRDHVHTSVLKSITTVLAEFDSGQVA